MSPLAALPETITAPRTDAIYNCHAYLTKVPITAIRPFVEALSAPGDTVVDFFAGSGMTGLAALMTGRKAVLSDISVLGQHVAKGYLADVSPSAFRQAATAVVETARGALGDLYKTRRASDSAVVEMARTVWSFAYICPACAEEIIYYEHLTPRGGPPEQCPSCGGPFARRNWPRAEDVPVDVVVTGEDGKLTSQEVSDIDRKMIAIAAADPRRNDVPSLPIDETREMYSRSGLGKAGLTETVRFFAPRNAIALLELWSAIQACEDKDTRHKLSFAFTAILPRASRRYQWSAKRPLNAQNQTYYIAPVYYEWNVFDLFCRKTEAVLRADRELFGGRGEPLFRRVKGQDVLYQLASADRLPHLPDTSVDYIFTDPPFGSNIFYSDMSLFHEAWLGRTTDNESEAVIHTTGKRKNGAAERYEDILRGAFTEGISGPEAGSVHVCGVRQQQRQYLGPCTACPASRRIHGHARPCRHPRQGPAIGQGSEFGNRERGHVGSRPYGSKAGSCAAVRSGSHAIKGRCGGTSPGIARQPDRRANPQRQLHLRRNPAAGHPETPDSGRSASR